MKLVIFAKRRKTKEGKQFTSYLSKLTKRDGTEQLVSVKFREECGNPDGKKCPMNIIVNKEDANLTRRTYTREDTGEPAETCTLWVSKWEMGEKYVDTSLDEFDID